MVDKREFWIVLIVSYVIAFLGSASPTHRMPLDYDAMIWRSIPCAFVWALVLASSLLRFKKQGLWLLLGSPMALYWPIWLVFNHFPACYYLGGCE